MKVHMVEMNFCLHFKIRSGGKGRSSTHFSSSLLKLMIPCASWRRLKSHRRKANRRFANLNGKIQIDNLLFSCASWIFFRRHKENWIKEKTKDLHSQRNKQNWKIMNGMKRWTQTKPIVYLYSTIIHSLILIKTIIKFDHSDSFNPSDNTNWQERESELS